MSESTLLSGKNASISSGFPAQNINRNDGFYKYPPHQQVLRENLISTSNEQIQKIKIAQLGKKIIFRHDSLKANCNSTLSVDSEVSKQVPQNAHLKITSMIRNIPNKDSFSTTINHSENSSSNFSNVNQNNRRMSLNLYEKDKSQKKERSSFGPENHQDQLFNESSIYKEDILEENLSNPINSSHFNAKKVSNVPNCNFSISSNKISSLEPQSFNSKKFEDFSRNYESEKKINAELGRMESHRNHSYDSKLNDTSGVIPVFDREKVQLESKIRVYIVTINELENKIKLLQTENNRISNYLDEKIKETEVLRSKLPQSDLGTSYDGMILELQERLNKMISTNQTCSKSTSSVLKELEILQLNYMNLKSKYERDNEKIRRELEEKESSLQRERNKWESQLNTLKDIYSTMEIKSQKLIKENESLKTDALEREYVIEQVKNKTDSLEKGLSSFGDSERMKEGLRKRTLELESKVAILITENDKLKALYDSRENELNLLRSENSTLNTFYKRELEEKNSLVNFRALFEREITNKEEEKLSLEKEITDLNAQIFELSSQIEPLKHKISCMDHEKRNLLMEFEKQKEQIIFEENNKLELNKNMFSSRIQELEIQLEKILNDNQCLNSLMSERIREVENLHSKIHSDEDARKKIIISFESQLKSLHEQLQKGKIEKQGCLEEANKKIQIIENQKNHNFHQNEVLIRELERKLEIKTEEHIEMRKLVNEMKAKCEDAKNTFSEILKDRDEKVEGMNYTLKENQRLQNEIENLKYNLCSLQQTIGEQRQEMRDILKKNEEQKELNINLKSTEKENFEKFEKVKKQNEEILKQKFEKEKTEIIFKMECDKENIKDTLSSLQAEKRKLQEEIADQRLKQQKALDSLNSQYKQNEDNQQAVIQNTKKALEVEYKRKLADEIEKREREYNSLKNNLSSSEEKIENLLSENNKLKRELESTLQNIRVSNIHMPVSYGSTPYISNNFVTTIPSSSKIASICSSNNDIKETINKNPFSLNNKKGALNPNINYLNRPRVNSVFTTNQFELEKTPPPVNVLDSNRSKPNTNSIIFKENYRITNESNYDRSNRSSSPFEKIYGQSEKRRSLTNNFNYTSIYT